MNILNSVLIYAQAQHQIEQAKVDARHFSVSFKPRWNKLERNRIRELQLYTLAERQHFSNNYEC